MCDIDSQTKSSVDIRSRNKAMTQSKSFNNLMKASGLNLIPESNEVDLDDVEENASVYNRKNSNFIIFYI